MLPLLNHAYHAFLRQCILNMAVYSLFVRPHDTLQYSANPSSDIKTKVTTRKPRNKIKAHREKISYFWFWYSTTSLTCTHASSCFRNRLTLNLALPARRCAVPSGISPSRPRRTILLLSRTAVGGSTAVRWRCRAVSRRRRTVAKISLMRPLRREGKTYL